jgi:hypothetical protein
MNDLPVAPRRDPAKARVSGALAREGKGQLNWHDLIL